jgi:hypothetical protein
LAVVLSHESNAIQPKEDPMKPENLKRLGALVGAALPALLAGAEVKADPALVEEGVSWCVQMREKVFECKEAFADTNSMINSAPAERRKALRAKFMEEITADGSGPLAPPPGEVADHVQQAGEPPTPRRPGPSWTG